ncbi:MAG: hypothetical protein V1792_03095 [Pseudomonadota bacterium]
MYDVSRTDYGVRIVAEGFVGKDELKNMMREASKVTSRLEKGFGLLFDARGMFALPPEAAEVLKHSMATAKRNGMGRSAQILEDAINTLQFGRLAREAGISDTMRQVDPDGFPDCERAAVDWIVKGIDPGK